MNDAQNVWFYLGQLYERVERGRRASDNIVSDIDRHVMRGILASIEDCRRNLVLSLKPHQHAILSEESRLKEQLSCELIGESPERMRREKE